MSGVSSKFLVQSASGTVQYCPTHWCWLKPARLIVGLLQPCVVLRATDNLMHTHAVDVHVCLSISERR